MKEQPVSERLRSLCYGPDFRASFFSAYVVNGCTFYTRDQDDKSTMQNSGVSLEAEAMYFSSSKDNRPVYSKMQYYGVIDEICELHYMGFSIAVFGCKWADNNNNIICDGLGQISMNLNKLGSEGDPYILASQAKQVFYMTDPLDKTRSVVIATKPRYAIDDHDDNIVSEERLMARKKKRASFPRDEEASIECENRRGRTVLKIVGNAIRKGIKLPLEWNRNKVPVGDNKDYFASYIGVVVRERVNINYTPWDEVHKEVINEVYDYITGVSSLYSLAVENDKGVHIVAVGEVEIIKFSAEYRKDIPKIKKNPFITWQKIECPRQPPCSKESGYYVGRYMIKTIALRQMFIPEKTLLLLQSVPAADVAVAVEFLRLLSVAV
ncbi:hypothetical protein SOVF_065330, partial [Spinacia oleracea]